VETSYSNTDNCKFESLQSEESNASDIASPNCLEVPNILTLTEEQCLIWHKTSRITKWNDMPEVWVETMAPPGYVYEENQVGWFLEKFWANEQFSKSRAFTFYVISFIKYSWFLTCKLNDWSTFLVETTCTQQPLLRSMSEH